MTRTLFALAAAALVAGTAPAADIKLTGENTKIEFVGSKPDGKHSGGFKKLDGKAVVADGKLTELDMTIDIDSLYSDDAKLTAHLMGPDFFNAKENPKATIKLDTVTKKGDIYLLTGKLTMCGKTGGFELPASVSMRDGGISISGEAKLDRTKWGMTYGKGKIDDTVLLKVAVTAKNKK